MRKVRKRKPLEPPLGTVFYEVGFKREEPRAPMIITWVYCGRVMENGNEYHLLVEYGKWWTLTNVFKVPIEGKHGLKIPSLDQLYEGRESWAEVVQWVNDCGKDWRKAFRKFME